jgi:hypothetical protein
VEPYSLEPSPREHLAAAHFFRRIPDSDLLNAGVTLQAKAYDRSVVVSLVTARRFARETRRLAPSSCDTRRNQTRRLRRPASSHCDTT